MNGGHNRNRRRSAQIGSQLPGIIKEVPDFIK
jgi:hypothetical protein